MLKVVSVSFGLRADPFDDDANTSRVVVRQSTRKNYLNEAS